MIYIKEYKVKEIYSLYIENLPSPENPDIKAIFMGSNLGTLTYNQQFIEHYLKEGKQFASPSLFRYTTSSAILGQLCKKFKRPIHATSFDDGIWPLVEGMEYVKKNSYGDALVYTLEKFPDYQIDFPIELEYIPTESISWIVFSQEKSDILVDDYKINLKIESVIKELSTQEINYILVDACKSIPYDEIQKNIPEEKIINLPEIFGYQLAASPYKAIKMACNKLKEENLSHIHILASDFFSSILIKLSQV